jgi:Ran GTPase-activating protein (RanGAP) involved in mRNA processing and transport
VNLQLIKGCEINFSSNFNLFKNILWIPTLKKLNLKGNHFGEKGLRYLCEFIQENTKLESLEFYGKKITENNTSFR